MRYSFHTYTLPNGVKVLTWPSDDTATIAVLILVRSGSRNETKEINGISHFVEHFLFKGTIHRPHHIDIVKELDEVGATYNAFTGKEYTGFYVVLDSSHQDRALSMLSDILQYSRFPEDTFTKEQQVILEEINMHYDTPVRRIADLWEQLLYRDQPAGWFVSGTKETIPKIKREDLVHYFQDQYRARSTIICIGGNFMPKDFRKKIQTSFMHVRKGAAKRGKRKVIEKQRSPQLFIEERTTDQAHIMLGVRAFGVHDPRKYALSVMSTILGGNMSSRLWHEIREQRGLAYYVSTEVDFASDYGYLVTSAGLALEKIEEALKIILAEYRRLFKEKVSKEELDRAKNFLVGKLHLGLESSFQKTNFMGIQDVLAHKVLTPDAVVRHIECVKQNDVLSVAKYIFQNSKLNCAMIGPIKGKDNIHKILTL